VFSRNVPKNNALGAWVVSKIPISNVNSNNLSTKMGWHKYCLSSNITMKEEKAKKHAI